jgi:predicted aspartyl protease
MMENRQYQRNYNNRNNFRNNNGERNVECYHCGRTGHIRPRCLELQEQNKNNEQRNNRQNYENRRNDNNDRNFRDNRNGQRNNGRNERSLNYISTSEEDRNVQEYESSEDEEYDCNRLQVYKDDDSENDEYPIYEFEDRKETFKRPTRERTNRITRSQSESKREREMLTNRNRKIQENDEMETNEDSDTETRNKGKMTRSEALQKAQRTREKKFTCRNCETIGHFTTNCPTLSTKEREKIMKAREKNKERKEKNFSIDLEQRIKNSPCGLTIGEAIKMVPGYKREFSKTFKVIKRGKEIKYMEIPKKPRFTSTRGKAKIEDIEIEAIIDTGAAISAMTRGLMEELGYKINKSSKVVIVTADGKKSRSLGKIMDMELTLEGVDTLITVEVMESMDRTLILGNDWLNKVNANIDYESGKLSIKGRNGYIDIPIKFSKENDDEEEEYEEEDLEETRI